MAGCANDATGGSISAQPDPPMTPPNKVTPSSCDHIAVRGPASPSWSAVSAWCSCGIVAVRNASVRSIGTST